MPGPSKLPAIRTRPGSGSQRRARLGWVMTFVLTAGLILVAANHAAAQTTNFSSVSNLNFAVSGCTVQGSTSNAQSCANVEIETISHNKNSIAIEILGNGTGSLGSNLISLPNSSTGYAEIYFTLSITAKTGSGATIQSYANSIVSTNSTYPYIMAQDTTSSSCTTGCSPSAKYNSPTTTNLTAGTNSFSIVYQMYVNQGYNGVDTLSSGTLTFTGTNMPEPTSVSVMAVGLFGLAGLQWCFGRGGSVFGRGRKLRWPHADW
jgi:hypothetical protein